MVTQHIPYASIKEDEKALQAIRTHEKAYAKSGGKGVLDDLWFIMRACWHPYPSSRPTIREVLSALDDWEGNAVRLDNQRAHSSS